MRHRGIAAYTGLGRSDGSDYCLENNWQSVKSDNFRRIFTEVCEDAYNTFNTFQKYDGLDVGFTGHHALLGVEPTYQYQSLFVIEFNFVSKDACVIKTGHAFRPWGTGIRSKTKCYGEYKNSSKFVRFIDKWYDTLKQAWEDMK